MMTHGRKTLICLLSGLSVCTLVTAALGNTPDSPYKAITDRNVFGLKPPPPPPDPTAEANKTPPPKITLTGITTIFGNKQALMKTPPGAVKPGEQPREQSYILAEGQREGDMEVIQIDEKAGSVKLVYAGTPVTLTFEKDGTKGAPGGAPGAVPPPGGMMPPGGPGRLPFPGTDGTIKTIPTRTMRLPSPTTGAAVQPAGYQQPVAGYQQAVGGYQQPAAGYQQPVAGGYQAGGVSVAPPGQYNTPGATTPGLSFGGNAAQQPFTPYPPESNVNAEQAAILMEVERQRLKNNGDPLADMMPHTELTPPSNTQQQTGTQQTGNNQNNQRPLPGMPPGLQPPGF